ncbi:MAG: phage head closure protein [Lysinibacillus sp.]
MQQIKYKQPINTGDLRNKVTFHKPPGEIINGWPSTDWTKFTTVWAKIQTQYGARLFNVDATQWQDKKIITVRYREDLEPTMRVEIKGTMHEIESLTNDDERNQWLTVIVKEVL